MTPAARVQTAIEILDALNATAMPADRFIRDWFRQRRYAGSKDRAAVAERVFDVLRHRFSYAWRMQSETPRALVIASLLREHASLEAIQSLFSGETYGPPPLSEAECAAIEKPSQNEPSMHACGEYPAWLEPELSRAFGAHLLDEMVAMQQRAMVRSVCAACHLLRLAVARSTARSR